MLIGLAGKKRAGKDTFAKAIKENLKGEGIFLVSFAEPIKKITKEIFNINDEELEKLKETPLINGISPRVFMQKFGTDLCRELFGQNIWTDLLFNKINNIKEDVIITDVRFDNEAIRIKEKGGIIIQIEREGYNKVDNHVSEKGISSYLIDYVVFNKGTIEEYKKNCFIFFKELKVFKEGL